jgi:TMEM164 family
MHHLLLFTVPLYLMMRKRFEFYQKDACMLKITILVGTLFFINVQNVAAHILMRNINFMLHPPPGIPLVEGPWYRWRVTVGLVVTTYLTELMCKGLMRLAHGRPAASQPKPQRNRKRKQKAH